MRKDHSVLAGGIAFLAIIAIPIYNATAEWAVEYQSKAVAACQGGATVNLTLSWDLPLAAIAIPTVVRSIIGGSFWMDPLPVDTVGGPSSGVTWSWSNPGWADLIQEFRPGVPTAPCVADGDIAYDGIPPDHFLIIASGAGTSTPPEPDGRTILTFSFDANGNSGFFEIDTACFSSSHPTMWLVDDQFPPINHGPSGTGETTFQKGIIEIKPNSCPIGLGQYFNLVVEGLTTEILTNPWSGSTYNDAEGDYPRFFLVSGPGQVDLTTGTWTWTPGCEEYGDYQVEIEVSDELHANCGPGVCPGNILSFGVAVSPGCCFCGDPFGDLNCDGALNPLDVLIIVWDVYRGQRDFCYPNGWYCPNPLADVDCDGTVNPLDVVYYVNKVYKNLDAFCMPCTE
jgi:hypothetical protein